MKVVLLAGGLGSRLAEETKIKPKPMVEIGGNTNYRTHNELVHEIWTH